MFLRGLKPELSDDNIKNHFKQYGKILKCNFFQNRGFGFLTFESEETMKELIKKGKETIGKHEVDLKKATPKLEKSKVSDKKINNLKKKIPCKFAEKCKNKEICKFLHSVKKETEKSTAAAAKSISVPAATITASAATTTPVSTTTTAPNATWYPQPYYPPPQPPTSYGPPPYPGFPPPRWW